MSSSSTDNAAAPSPRLSIVVVAFNDPALLRRCLEALAVEVRSRDIETVVVAKWPSGRTWTSELVAARAAVRWIEVPTSLTVPQMRGTGITESRGEIVALIEDDCVVEEGWCTALFEAHRSPAVAIGGAVEPGPYRRALDWAVYFCDYGRFMRPVIAGPAAALPGNNMSYKRRAIAELPAALRGEFQEAFVHDYWQRKGAPMLTDPGIVITNVNSWTIEHVTTIPYHHARAYAGLRVVAEPLWRRLTMSALTPLLPVVKVWRIARDTLSRRRYVGKMLRALPMIGMLAISWSAGELMGYLKGPGRSAARWR